jgi:hypothetical protein
MRPPIKKLRECRKDSAMLPLKRHLGLIEQGMTGVTIMGKNGHV